ncbi:MULTISPECIES: M48 family metallopeptidase [Dethiosulfovibrio]|uniref:M48 family metalloprotease n=2 Tax=Dethiosulfovibrio TaxID=47054 RepID=A0ABS9EMM9_9BACT|nr:MULTISPECIES: M48 family metallopeptidase [Dethiosulfovibrio]MCF4114931.1 M48 family metalloprotease [Dethiosulfovibrio russensis]MCF4142452.1 M48 family metalloprotease [Dethiosulfovibrio marinus]MCF4145423.1 M48 family metalloprotease [Dethiosulfovibrio acidaminovorans]
MKTKKINLKKWSLWVLSSLVLLLTVEASDAKVSNAAMERAWDRLSKTTGFEASLHLEDKDETNAYITMEDGKYKIVVFQGLLDIMNTEDQIAGVIAHEIGHGMHGHLESGQKRNAGIGILAAVLSELLDSDTGDIAIGIGATLAVQGYSREQEVEADDAGVEYSYKAGYSAWSLYNAIKRMADDGLVTSPSGFNSHPPTERRMTRLAAQARRWEESGIIKKKADLPKASIPRPKIIQVEGVDPDRSDQSDVLSTYPIDGGLKNVLGIIHREGYAKYSSGKYEEAFSAFAKGLDFYSGNYLAALWAARSAYKAGDEEKARRWIERALSINGRYEPALKFRDEFLE